MAYFSARVGYRPRSMLVHGIHFLDSFLLSLSSCSRMRTLCKGGVMIRLLGFGDWNILNSFLATYRVLGTVLYLYNSFFLFSCTLFPTVWLLRAMAGH